MTNHIKDKSFLCDFCEKNFLHQDSLVKYVKENHKVTPTTVTKLDDAVTNGPSMTLEPCRRKTTSPRICTPKRKEENIDIVADILKSGQKLQQLQ